MSIDFEEEELGQLFDLPKVMADLRTETDDVESITGVEAELDDQGKSVRHAGYTYDDWTYILLLQGKPYLIIENQGYHPSQFSLEQMEVALAEWMYSSPTPLQFCNLARHYRKNKTAAELYMKAFDQIGWDVEKDRSMPVGFDREFVTDEHAYIGWTRLLLAYEELRPYTI